MSSAMAAALVLARRGQAWDEGRLMLSPYMGKPKIVYPKS